MAGALRELVRQIDPAVPVEEIRTMDQAIGRSLAERRLHLSLLALFSAVALVLAVLGIYGVLSYAVGQRTREVAIRLALGARPRAVMRLVVGQGMRLTAVGLALGMAGALALTRVLASQLYGVSPTDPLTFVAVAALLLGSATIACLLPARQATRIDPMIALRSE
jgi:putative ABC transport system permease protein